VAVWIRLKLKESPEFAKLEARHQVDHHPLAHLIANSKKNVLLVWGLRMAENGGSSLYQSLAISYMVMATGLKGQAGAIALLLAGLSGAVVIPLTGLWSDRAGRVPVYRFYAMFQLLMAFPSWWVLSVANQALSAAAVCIGVAAGREVSAVFAGGIAPMIGAAIVAWTTHRYGGTREAAAVTSQIPMFFALRDDIDKGEPICRKSLIREVARRAVVGPRV
jgi:MFS transporter, MHS family, metabolite:H+ symporter